MDKFKIAPSSKLRFLQISNNNLSGSFPLSLFGLLGLDSIDLSSNKLSGQIHLTSFSKLVNLTSLVLSHNQLSVKTSGDNDSSSTLLLPNIRSLKLASCKLQKFPDLKNLSSLEDLDLSDNQMTGEIPNWMWTRSISELDLSLNMLATFQKPYIIPSLRVLNLRSNHLTGEIPIPMKLTGYADYSHNSFSSSLPPDIGNKLEGVFFSVSNNNLAGTIPASMFDLSHNGFSGKIPSCLLEKRGNLQVINLGNNNLTGKIPDEFTESCALKTLDAQGNDLEGHIPTSLANCSTLEVLNLGNNHLDDTFPCFLKNCSALRVLVLRFNNFHGGCLCPGPMQHWPSLQILDIASNNFIGKVPQNWFVNWTGLMTDHGKDEGEHFKSDYSSVNYQDSVTITIKGQELELVKILTIFNTVDISNNMFEGDIPERLETLKLLRLLNLSHNAYMGSIPPSLGNLKQLESLDLSVNRITGTIPTELTSLTFLSFLNLSYNQLTGEIPDASQFSTFTETSFQGNKGLCGDQLNITCVGSDRNGPSSTSNGNDQQHYSDDDEIKWEWISAEIGFVLGFGIIIMPLVSYRRWREYYYERIDRFLFKTKNQGTRNRGGRMQGRLRR